MSGQVNAGKTSTPISERMPPFYCPYCGEEDLEPRAERGNWYCHSCARAFTVSFVGVGVRP